jgi:pimeloyl-ACP methyl ester carboxylesterase
MQPRRAQRHAGSLFRVLVHLARQLPRLARTPDARPGALVLEEPGSLGRLAERSSSAPQRALVRSLHMIPVSPRRSRIVAFMESASHSLYPAALGAAERNSVSRPVRVRCTKYEQKDATVLGDVQLRYVDVRPDTERGPPVVMLHGLASRLEEYEQIVDTLRAGRRIIAMDLPGNGYSDKPDRPYTLAFLEDAVLGLLDRLALSHADLAGGSLGGNLALRLGHREPERFRRLVAWSPAGAWEPMVWLGALGRLLIRLRAGASLFWPIVWLQSRFCYRSGWSGRRSALAESFEHYREIHGPSFVRMYFELACEQVLTSLFPIAPSIAQRTLVLWGDEDHALGMGRGVKRLVELLPDAQLRVVCGARHSLASEAPEEVASEMDRFLGAA